MKMRSAGLFTFARSVLGAFLILCSAAAAFAQAGRGGISGTVTDNSGASVSNATVEALDQAKGTKLAGKTTGGGVYTFVSVLPGTYTVTVTHEGFQAAVRKDVVVTVDQTLNLNVQLGVGEVNQSVTVDESSSLLDTSTATVGQLINSQTMDRVPQLTRDVYQLVQLSAGVLPANGTPNSSDLPGINNARSLVDVSSYTINGSIQGSVYYMLDGSPIGIAENNVAAIIPAFQVPEDGVDQFRVETQNTPVTYASGAGGVISLVTKSGTNKLHGDAFGYFRPAALAANDFFYKRSFPGQAPLDFHRYQEGGSIGGPIIKDKLFFFGDYEATQQTQLENAVPFTVPTAAERMGDFSADSFTIYNPLVPEDPTPQYVNGPKEPPVYFRTPFDMNKIPKGDLDPVALKFANALPLPNAPGNGDPYHTNNYVGSGVDPLHSQKFDVRVDYTLNARNRLFGRFSYGRLDFANADLYGGSNPYDPYLFNNLTNTRNVILGDDITIGKNSVLQLRYSFTRHFENQGGDPRQQGYDLTQAGFPQSLADQVNYKQAPVFLLGGTAPFGGATNFDVFQFASENSDATATLTKLIGKHELSFGAEYQKLFMNVGQPANPSGTYSFDTNATNQYRGITDASGSDFASFLIGVGTGLQGGAFTKDLFAAEASPYYAAFVQDNYHIYPKLTLNLGLRWDIFGGRTERHDRLEYFNPTLGYTVGGVPLKGGEVFSGNGHRSPFTTNLKNFAPRASFSYQALDHLVFRGGGGIYYGPTVQMAANGGLDADGYQAGTNWDASELDDFGNFAPVNRLSNPFPDGIVQPVGGVAGAATNIGNGVTSVLHSPRTVTTYNFNFGFQYEFPGRTLFSLAYVGSRGLFIPFGGVDLNTLSLQTIQKYGSSLCIDTNAPDCAMVANPYANVPGSNFEGQATAPLWYTLQAFPQFNAAGASGPGGVFINGYNHGDSEYSSLQTKVERQMSHHVSMLASFTWGKLMSDVSQTPLGFVGYHVGSPQNIQNLELEHSISGQDVRFQFTGQASWELPIGKGRALNLTGSLANSLLGGWTLNAIGYLSDGVPIAAPGSAQPIGYFNQRVNLNCDPSAGAKRSSDQWFSPNCFSTPASPFVPGSAPEYIGSIRTDGAHQVDTSLYKTFALPGDREIRLEAAAFNTLNTVQMGYPNVYYNQDPSQLTAFGQIYNAANSPRQFQFAARFKF